MLGGEFRWTLGDLEAWCQRTALRRPGRRKGAAASGEGCVTLLEGDALEVLRALPSDAFRRCGTSPPYWRRRDHGAAGQLGQEPTVEAYCAALVRVFREVRRVLARDGTLWLTLGDARNGHSRARPNGRQPGLHGFVDGRWSEQVRDGIITRPVPGLKPTDMLLLPYEVAAALRADGWFLKSGIIWRKTAHLPEPVTGRPSACYEHVWLLARSRRHFFDAAALEEPASGGAGVRNGRDVWDIASASGGGHPAAFPPELARRCVAAGSAPGDAVLDCFAGGGTVGLAAAALGRRATLVELSPEYARLARGRLGDSLIR